MRVNFKGSVTPQDLTATFLGYESHTEICDTQGRPIAISRGEVIRSILA